MTSEISKREVWSFAASAVHQSLKTVLTLARVPRERIPLASGMRCLLEPVYGLSELKYERLQAALRKIFFSDFSPTRKCLWTFRRMNSSACGVSCLYGTCNRSAGPDHPGRPRSSSWHWSRLIRGQWPTSLSPLHVVTKSAAALGGWLVTRRIGLLTIGLPLMSDCYWYWRYVFNRLVFSFLTHQELATRCPSRIR